MRSVFPHCCHRKRHTPKEEVLGWEEVQIYWIWVGEILGDLSIKLKYPGALYCIPVFCINLVMEMTAAPLQQCFPSCDARGTYGELHEAGQQPLFPLLVTKSSDPLSQYQTGEAKCEGWRAFLDLVWATRDNGHSLTWNLLTPEQKHKDVWRLCLN